MAPEVIAEQETINTYSIRGLNVRLKETLILLNRGGVFQIGGGFPYAKEITAGRGNERATYYEMRNAENKTVFITDQEGYYTLTGSNFAAK
jgi:hypothetical protein